VGAKATINRLLPIVAISPYLGNSSGVAKIWLNNVYHTLLPEFFFKIPTGKTYAPSGNGINWCTDKYVLRHHYFAKYRFLQ